MEKFIKINNEKIFVETLGNPKNTPILYIHGSPGIGVSDFVKFQGSKFKKNYFLVAVEQRGVWRSSKIDNFDLNKIIDEYETIRQKLHIEKWTLISHCFGARISLEYFKRFPNFINKIVFENPVLDMYTPLKKLLELELKMYKDKFSYSKYKSVINELNNVSNYKNMEQISENLARLLNLNLNSIIMSKITTKKLILLRKKYSYANAIKSRETETLMSDDEMLFDTKSFNRLMMDVPILVIFGGKDIIVPMSTIQFLEKHAKNINIKKYYSKHWIHIDESNKYFNDVNAFLR